MSEQESKSDRGEGEDGGDESRRYQAPSLQSAEAKRSMSQTEYNRQLHYLDPGFKKNTLAEYRNKLVVPFEVDEQLNSILWEIPHVFSLVLTPIELSLIATTPDGYVMSMLDLHREHLRGKSEKDLCLEMLKWQVPAAEKLHCDILEFLKSVTTREMYEAEFWLQERCEGFPAFSVSHAQACARLKDLGECPGRTHQRTPMRLVKHRRAFAAEEGDMSTRGFDSAQKIYREKAEPAAKTAEGGECVRDESDLMIKSYRWKCEAKRNDERNADAWVVKRMERKLKLYRLRLTGSGSRGRGAAKAKALDEAKTADDARLVHMWVERVKDDMRKLGLTPAPELDTD